MKHTKFKLYYFVKNFIRMSIPFWACRMKKSNLLSKLNKLKNTTILEKSIPLSKFKFRGSRSFYFFDTNEFTRLFNKTLKINLLFGDIIHIPEEPTIVKSRPINDHNQNSVLLNLDKFRHFNFINDNKDFSKKKNILVARGDVNSKKYIELPT